MDKCQNVENKSDDAHDHQDERKKINAPGLVIVACRQAHQDCKDGQQDSNYHDVDLGDVVVQAGADFLQAQPYFPRRLAIISSLLGFLIVVIVASFFEVCR